MSFFSPMTRERKAWINMKKSVNASTVLLSGFAEIRNSLFNIGRMHFNTMMAGLLPQPGTTEMRSTAPSEGCAAFAFSSADHRPAAMPSGGSAPCDLISRSAVRRNHRREEASFPICAAMVTAWLRQRRNPMQSISGPGRSKYTRNHTDCSRVQRPVYTAALQGGSLAAPMRFHTDLVSFITETGRRR